MIKVAIMTQIGAFNQKEPTQKTVVSDSGDKQLMKFTAQAAGAFMIVVDKAGNREVQLIAFDNDNSNAEQLDDWWSVWLALGHYIVQTESYSAHVIKEVKSCLDAIDELDVKQEGEMH